jgi:Flp pilus assembly protein TadG
MTNARRRRGSKGSAMVELALSVCVFVPLLFGVFEFGYAFYTYNKLIGVVRNGARYASLRAYDSSTSTPSDSFLTAVRNATVYGDPSGTGSPVVFGLTTAKISVSVTMSGGVPDVITVYVNDFSVDALGRTLHWMNKPTATFRFEGRFAPPQI